MFLQKLLHYLRLKRDGLRAAFSHYLVEREVVKVLRLTHAQELAATPRNEWALVRSRQQQEIHAVQSGQIDIVDRRSWSYPYIPEALHRLNQPVLKNTPYNLRRFSETPIPRRAINLIKNAILAFDWQIAPTTDEDDIDAEREKRIQILTKCLNRPNNTDSFRTLWEAVLEDLIIGGYGCVEPRLTMSFKRPFKLWSVDGSTVRIFLDWSESTPDRPHYAQMTGLKGERGIVTFLDNELLYIRDNVRTSTPFGLGKLEVAFNTVNAFLGAQDMAARAGADQVHKTWLWWETTINPSHIQNVRRHIINELEGQAKISLQSGLKKPEVIDVKAVTPEDLLLDWQEFLIRIIANAFDISPLSLGLEKDVNRNTGQVMADADFRNAVVPMARRLEEAINTFIRTYLQWDDLEFSFIGLEDPDSLTKTMMQQRQYMMNALTPDEIREELDKPPLPGGWGRLTMYQMNILLQEVMQKAKAGQSGGAGAGGGTAGFPGSGNAASGFGGGAGGMGTGGGGMGMGSGSGGGMGMGSGGGVGGGLGSSMSPTAGSGGMMGGSIGKLGASAYDIAQMLPDEISMYQELGLLPPTQQLAPMMEQQAPGILDTLTQELTSFFELQKQLQDETEVQPAPVTEEDEAEQQRKFDEFEHTDSELEQVMNRRRFFGPSVDQSVTKSAQRGKYPRTADGGFRGLGDTRKDYRPGKGNPYK